MPPEVIREKHVQGADVKLYNDQIILLDLVDPGIKLITEDIIASHIDAIAHLAQGKRCGVLITVTAKTTLEARKYAQKHLPEIGLVAGALIANTPMERVIGNFLIGVFNIPLKMKLFRNLDEARSWLLNQLSID